VSDWHSLAGHTALVTGSARGIGLEIARGLGRCGATVLLNGRKPAGLDVAVDDLASAGIQARPLCFDVTDHDAAAEALASAGAIDVLVNNVGQRDRRDLTQLRPSDLSRLLDADLTSVYTLSRLVATDLIARRSPGRIINISSIIGQLGRAGDIAYSAAKAGVDGLTRAMAAELGPHAITVNAVAPGPTATETNAHLVADPEWTAWLRRNTAIGRWGRPEEIAGVVTFLAGDAATFVTGQTIAVDGGMSTTF